MNIDQKLLLIKIEITRAKLNNLASEANKHSEKQLIELSEKLDELIFDYMRNTSKIVKRS